MNKKKKIVEYLKNKIQYTVFDELLDFYISGELKSLLESWELLSVSIYVDWKDINKCIDVQAKYNQHFYEWQFYENECEYMIYIDGEEPDEASYIDYSDINGIRDLIDKMYSLLQDLK